MSGEEATVNIRALEKEMVAKRIKIMKELGLIPNSPAKNVTASHRKTKTKSKSKSKVNSLAHARIRANKRLANALASGKTRKRLPANARLLEEANMLPDRLKRGAPLVRIEGDLPKLSLKKSLAYSHAQLRANKRLAKAMASGKTRKRLPANARLLEEADVLPDRLKRGAPLVRIEGDLPKKSSRD